MKYMTFPASCSFCCLANRLEDFGIERSDRDIALEADLPYVFRYEDGCFSTGAMLQSAGDYNRCLSKYGLRLTETELPRECVPEFLGKNAKCMLGIEGEFGKHAMLFLDCKNSSYEFLNPHRADDGQADTHRLTESELLDRLDETCVIATVQKSGVYTVENDQPEISLEALGLYRKKLTEFVQKEHTRAEITACRDALLRPFALDLSVMMELAGESALCEKLFEFQQQVFGILRLERCVPGEHIDMALFETILEEYKKLITAYWRNKNDQNY